MSSDFITSVTDSAAKIITGITDTIPAHAASLAQKASNDGTWNKFTSAFGATSSTTPSLVMDYGQILFALTTAAILGAFIAFHPKRHGEPGGPVSEKELKKTMIMIPVAGVVMVSLVQDNLARAFGLVGIGNFVRFRTAMRNPGDLAIIFILIGVGMACGMQQYEFSATITGFFYILMYVLDFSAGACHFSWNLRIDSTNPLLVERIFNQIARNNNLRIHKVRSSKQGGNFRCNFSAKRQIDTDALTEDIKELCGEEVIFTRFDWELNKK